MTSSLTKLSVLIPVYNEARTLRTIISRVLEAETGLEMEILCVDDASSDASWAILQELATQDIRIRAYRHETNRGKGAAIRTAIEHITGDVSIVQDADLEYNPAEFKRVLKPIIDGRADAVFGSRFASSPERRVLFFWHSFGNRVLTGLCNVFNNLNLTDMETCYKAVRSDLLKSLRLQSDGFGIEPELTTRLAQWGARIYEVPISYDGRTYEEGKKIGWRDGVQAVWLLFYFRFLDTTFSQHSGHTTLEGLSGARRLNRWILDQFSDIVGGRVLEAGCGVGNLTKLLLESDRLVAVDVDPFYVSMVDRAYGHLENVRVETVDLQAPDWADPLHGEKFDTVLCINVLEHLEKDERAVVGFRSLLTDEGLALILVPAHMDLFSATDSALDHYRRYSRSDVEELFTTNGFGIVDIRPFNKLGVLGWRINKALKKTSVGKWQARLFDVAVIAAREIDRLPGLRGLSWIVIARKIPDAT